MKKRSYFIIMILIAINLIGCTTETKKVTESSHEKVQEVGEATGEEKEEASQKVAEKKEKPSKDYIKEETETTVTYMDKFGTLTKVTKKPEKVVIAYNSILGLWYYMGGTSLTKVKGTVNVPEEALDNMDLGSTRGISLEAIIALEPDLVILAANVESQVALAPILQESGIETMIIDTSVKPYQRFRENAYLFSRIIGTEGEDEERIRPIIQSVDLLIEQAKTVEDKPSVAAIFTTSKSMSLESDIALTGEIIHLLGGSNILNASEVKAEGETRVPFSIEAIVAKNPEIIMISTMGSVDAAKEYVGKMIEENPVWHELDAVKNGRVYYLPKAYSVYKPNEKYAEAFAHIGSLLYPEVLGE